MARDPVKSLDDTYAWHVPASTTVFWAGRRHRYCVVIPVINEGERISRLLGRMRTLDLSALVDVLLIDGGSTDGSLDPDRLKALGVAGLLVKTGAGKLGAQLRCAYAFALGAGHEGIITIDGNDKDDPDAIPAFVAALDEGYDFVQGSRYVPGGLAENTPLLRDLAIRLVHAPLASLSAGFRWTDTTQGFRGYSRRMLLDPNIAPFREVFMGYELLVYLSCRVPRLGYRCIELPTARRYPPGDVPTKISSIRGNLAVLGALLRAAAGRYNPGVAP